MGTYYGRTLVATRMLQNIVLFQKTSYVSDPFWQRQMQHIDVGGIQLFAEFLKINTNGRVKQPSKSREMKKKKRV